MARRSYFNIEALMNNHGAAGKSIVRNIMSYLPIQTLTRGLKVSKVSSIFRFFIVRFVRIKRILSAVAQKIRYLKCGSIGLSDFLPQMKGRVNNEYYINPPATENSLTNSKSWELFSV